MIMLNLGAAGTKIDGWTPIDRKLPDSPNKGEVYPLLDFKDNSVDAIRASHVLEHFPHFMTARILKDWVRALKPGGMLKIAVPDFDYACKNFGHPHAKLWIMGGQVDEDDFHCAIFREPDLRKMLSEAGLEGIQTWKSEIQDCASLPVSLNLSGTKPKPQPTPKARIACAVSIPRLGFNDAWGCAVAALMPWGIPIRRYTGAWWERSLQNVLEDLIAEDFEYVVTLDYDSMFTAPMFKSLLDAISNNPGMDAVAPLQAMRGGAGLTLCDPIGKNADNTIVPEPGKPMEVNSAHFGLTILRLVRLKDIPRPWFLNVPGKDGSWRREDETVVDADIYFWRKWRANGRNIFVLPWVSIGHIETVVSEINPETGKPRHVYPSKWMHEKFGS